MTDNGDPADGKKSRFTRREMATVVAGAAALSATTAIAQTTAAPRPARKTRRNIRPGEAAFRYLDEYQNKYENVKLARDARGVLTITLHSNGGAPNYENNVKNQLVDVFWNVGADRDNEVVIFTALGDSMLADYGGAMRGGGKPGPGFLDTWPETEWNTKHALENLLDIEVPIISAIPGPCNHHTEWVLLSDVVLASPTFSFSDNGHFLTGRVPGDGAQIVYPMLMGANRARYFMLTGQIMGVEEAHRLGIVNEIVPRANLLARANEIAAEILRRPRAARRGSRIVFTYPFKKAVVEQLGYGLMLEGYGSLDNDLGGVLAARPYNR
jgi:enoyl-CoA hydratase/carnithine racemase